MKPRPDSPTATKLVCPECGNIFFRWPSEVKPINFCSQKCVNLSKRGEGSQFWNGGKGVDRGYIWITSEDGKRIYEHRDIIQKALGRKLKRNEHVHHINGNKADNRIENLQVVTPAKHTAIHSKIDRWARHFDSCKFCKTTKVKHHGNGVCHNCYNYRKSHGLPL